MPRKLSKKDELIAKTDLIADVDSNRRMLNKLKDELTDKKARLENLKEEKNVLIQKLSKRSVNKCVLSKRTIDEKSNHMLPLESEDPLVSNIRLMSAFSCIRWDFKNGNKDIMRGYLSEKDQFKVIDCSRVGSDDLWNMMDCY